MSGLGSLDYHRIRKWTETTETETETNAAPRNHCCCYLPLGFCGTFARVCGRAVGPTWRWMVGWWRDPFVSEMGPARGGEFWRFNSCNAETPQDSVQIQSGEEAKRFEKSGNVGLR
uniref:Uncharacterized protein n=1 Tax=Oryza nivara TaxID=4536 RepID=A0A0E0G948_ORYNI